MSRELLILLPTYNEAGNLPRLVMDLRRLHPAATLLVVDDGSPDGTGDLADKLAAEDPGVEVIHRPTKSGLGSAHVLGMDQAIEREFEILVTMDCDYTHQPQDVGLLVAGLRDRGGDLVIGSRYKHEKGIADWPLWRRGVTRTAHFMTTYLLGIPFDATNAFRAYDVAALRRIPYREIRGDGYSFMFEMVFACVHGGLRVSEVPVVLPIRASGKSKISRREVYKAIAALVRLAFVRAGHLRSKTAAREGTS